MDILSFSCPTCGRGMKIGADKAGRRAKCPKCQTPFIIPSKNQPAVAAKAQTGKVGGLDEDEDGAYGVQAIPTAPDLDDLQQGDGKTPFKFIDEKANQARRKRNKEQRQQRIDELASMRKVPISLQSWKKVRMACAVISIGLLFCIGSFALQKLVLVTGIIWPSQYPYVAANSLIDPQFDPSPGQAMPLYRAQLGVGLLGGGNLTWLWMMVFSLAFVCMLVQLVLNGVGYTICLGAPKQNGLRGLALTALVVTGLNIVFTFFFRLLPMTGLVNYTMLQLVTPEIALTQGNIYRLIPIHVAIAAAPFWEGAAPFWEGAFVFFLRMNVFLELVLLCSFLRYAALTMQDEAFEKKTHGLIQLSLGLAFMDMGMLLLTSTGTSEVLIYLLRGVYVFYVAFYLWLLVWIIMMLNYARGRIQRVLRLGFYPGAI